MKKYCLLLILILISQTSAEAQRLIKTLTGHTNAIASLNFDESGKMLVSGSWDKTIRVWNPIAGTTTRIIETGKSIVFCTAISKDAKSIACGNWSQSINIYNTATGDISKTFKAHLFKTNHLVYSPNGKTLLSVGIDSIKLWNAATYAPMFQMTGHKADINTAVFNPNNTTIASASYDGTVIFWNATNGSIIKSIKAHAGNAPALDYSNDGKYLITLGEEGCIKIWDAVTYVLLSSINNICSGANDMDVSSDGKTIAVSGKDNNVYLINMWESRTVAVLKGHTKAATCLTFSPNGELIATAGDDNNILVWDLSDMKYLKCVEEKMKAFAEKGRAKDEFETSDQYNKRMVEYERIKLEKKRECAQEDAILKIEAQATVEGNQLATYRYVTLKISQIGTFNADKLTYDITVEGLVYSMKIPMEEAKTFKGVWQQAAVKGIQRANPTTKKVEYINLQVVHPLTNVAYMIGTQVLPSTDKYLREFLDKNPQPW
jgi:hypothetical protein